MFAERDTSSSNLPVHKTRPHPISLALEADPVYTNTSLQHQHHHPHHRYLGVLDSLGDSIKIDGSHTVDDPGYERIVPKGPWSGLTYCCWQAPNLPFAWSMRNLA